MSLEFRTNAKVPILVRNCSEYIVFALTTIGVIPGPINFQLVGEEIEYSVNDSDSAEMCNILSARPPLAYHSIKKALQAGIRHIPRR